MTDLRKATEMALEALESVYGKGKRCEAAIQALRQALAQPEHGNNNPNYPITEANTPFVDAVNTSQERVDETAKRKHEPAAWMCSDELVRKGYIRLSNSKDETWNTPLYTAPSKREWVGLTVNEARKFYEKYTDREELIYAIDEFLEEKNSG